MDQKGEEARKKTIGHIYFVKPEPSSFQSSREVLRGGHSQIVQLPSQGRLDSAIFFIDS